MPLKSTQINSTQIKININDAMNYAESLEGLPFRWYNSEKDSFAGNDKFWCENSSPPSAEDIRNGDKSICCTGLPNLMRRFCGLNVPGLNGTIFGKHKQFYLNYPGGTGAWFLYLYQNKRLQKFNIKSRYPRGTLLIARYKDDVKDQGHLAVVYDDVDEKKTMKDQRIIHSTPTIEYKNLAEHKDHGSVKIESFNISNELFKWDKISYYKWVCLPENWLLLD